MSPCRRSGLSACLMLLVACRMVAAAAEPVASGTMSDGSEPYTAWAAGRPAEALPGLRQAAEQPGATWTAWYDLGLAGAAAGQAGPAAAWLVQARNLAPQQDEPVAALRALGHTTPPRWMDHLGPIATPGRGCLGAVLLALAGGILGFTVAQAVGRARRRTDSAGSVPVYRATLLTLAGTALVLAAPGVIAGWQDQHNTWIATSRDTSLLDSAGSPIAPLPAGTIALRDPQEPWAGRVVITLPDGARGFLAIADTVP